MTGEAEEEERIVALGAVVSWLRTQGFVVREGTRFSQTFNHGIWIEDGELVYDADEAHPGDLLHDAGHLAVLPECVRSRIAGGDIEDSLLPLIRDYMEKHPQAVAFPEDPAARALLQSSDLEVIAWAWAAALAAGVNPRLTCANGFPNEGDVDATVVGLKARNHPGIEGLLLSGFVSSPAQYPRLNFWKHP